MLYLPPEIPFYDRSVVNDHGPYSHDFTCWIKYDPNKSIHTMFREAILNPKSHTENLTDSFIVFFTNTAANNDNILFCIAFERSNFFSFMSERNLI